MIRLLLTVASAAAVVWFVGSRPDVFAPESEQARQVLERAAHGVGQLVGEAGERAAQLLAPNGQAAPPEDPAEQGRAEEVAVDPEAAVERPAATRVAAESEFGPEAPDPVSAPPAAPPPGAAREAGPLDVERAALVRARLDRVMALAAGSSR